MPVVAVGVNVCEDEQDNHTQGHCPFRSNWRCLCPRDHWQTVLERARSNDSTDWIQCAADGALALLRHAYELSEASECSCTFAGFQSFGGKKLTADDDLGDAFVVFDWAVGPRQRSFSSKVLYEELARVVENYCDPTVPCNCKAGALVEPPAAMAQRLLEKDQPRRCMLAAAKNSEDLAAALIPRAPSKPLRVMAITPLYLLRFTAFEEGHVELQLPEQKPLKCVYLGQPKEDGNFAHASLDWAAPERGIKRTNVSFEWHAQRGDQTLVARTDPPLRFGTLEKSQQIGAPEHFLMAKKLLDVFEGICHRSLARLGKHKPPCTIAACRLLGSPKRASIDPGDIHTLSRGDGTVAEHLLTGHIKAHEYVCCTEEGAWKAARAGRLGFKHFVVRDLSSDAPRGGTKLHERRGQTSALMSLARADSEATSAIVAVGSLMASCARTTLGGWRSQISIDTDGFEPDPWRWPYAAQSTRPLVWALWTTNPVGDGWQGKPKRFLTAVLVKDVLGRGHLPIPKALKTAPLAPLDSYWHPLATPPERRAGLHHSLVLEMNPFNYVLNPPLELQQWVRRRGLDIISKDPPPDGVATSVPPFVSDRNQASKGSSLGPGAFGDGDSSGPEMSTDSDSEGPQETAANLTYSVHSQTQVTGVADNETSEDEDTCDPEYRGPYYIETDEQERDRLFAGIRDEEEREIQYQAYLRRIDELELGYGYG